MISCFAVPTAMAASATISEGTYYIYSKLDNNKVVDVSNGLKDDRTNVQLYQYNGTNAQKFKIKKSGNYYTISCVCSGKMLDVAGGSDKSGTNVWQYKANGSKAQKWKFIDAGNGYYYIISALGTFLDVSGGGTADETNIWAYKGNGTDSQKWKLVNVSDNSGWQYPMKGYKTTQTFGNGGHLGIDIKSTSDEYVYAAANGTVVAVGLNGTGTDASKISSPKGNGYYVVIKHSVSGKPVYSMYAHLQKGSILVSKGQSVSKGAKIAKYGNTGNSTGRHLHFAIADTYKPGSYYGYTRDYTTFSGNSKKESRSEVTFYNPVYVIKNGKLP